MTEVLKIDDLQFDVRRSSRRTTMEIIVDRGGELIISAPEVAPEHLLVEFIREKRFWIYSKIAEKERLQQPVGTKEFVNGEGFLYLGRSYRLLLVEESDTPLQLKAGRFRLARSETLCGRECFVQWYRERGLIWLSRRLARWASRMGVKPTEIRVQDLGFRWGSCGKSGSVNFHWATLLFPPPVIDYVIVHELAHLVEPDHSKKFWNLVAKTLPEYEHRKTWLAERGGRELVL